MKNIFLIIIFCMLVISPSIADDFDFLFIHHSVGSNWLDQGLRSDLQNPALTAHTIRVHSATYGDTIGDYTDVFRWYPKFRDQINLIMTFDKSKNNYYSVPGKYNQIVMFKSCYPNSDIASVGTPPGDPVSGNPTIWNHKAAYTACAGIFQKNPNVLFVAVTSPPCNPAVTNVANAARARQFHNWLKTTWVSDYRKITGLKNVVVFDLFDVLANSVTHSTEPNMLQAAYRVGTDSHPTKPGNLAATALFLPFITAAVSVWKSSGSNGGCPGTGNLIPALAMVGSPQIGNSSFALGLTNARANASAIFLAGKVSISVPLGGSCSLEVGTPFMLFPGIVGVGGSVNLPMPIPNVSSLVGGHVYFQSFIYDTAGAIGPNILVSSNGLDVQITP